MPKTVVKENETIEDALRRFKRDVSRSGTLAEARKREYYLKPSVSKKLKKKENKRKKNLLNWLLLSLNIKTGPLPKTTFSNMYVIYILLIPPILINIRFI